MSFGKVWSKNGSVQENCKILPQRNLFNIHALTILRYEIKYASLEHPCSICKWKIIVVFMLHLFIYSRRLFFFTEALNTEYTLNTFRAIFSLLFHVNASLAVSFNTAYCMKILLSCKEYSLMFSTMISPGKAIFMQKKNIFGYSKLNQGVVTWDCFFLKSNETFFIKKIS